LRCKSRGPEGLTPDEKEEFAVLSAKLDVEAKAKGRTDWIHVMQDAIDAYAAEAKK
jgi:hypothetical protein